MHNPFLTVVTPTYNRAEMLRDCFESLCRQSDKDFEWIIVDDGSSDNTAELVESFHPSFPLIYRKKENGGKHTALNASHPYIHGQFVLILDSDDYLTDTAVEQIKKGWKDYKSCPEVGIVTFLKGKSEHEPTCEAPEERKVVDIMRYRRVTHFSSDCCEVIRADLFKQFPFPVFENERFLSEGALWNRVSFTHKCVYINWVVYICRYQEGGLTKSGRHLRIRNPQGGMYTANLNMSRKNYLSRRMKNGLLYTCYGFFAKIPVSEMLRRCDSGLLALCCLPFGYLLYRYWNRKYG